MPCLARVHRNSRRAQSGAGAAAGPAKAHRTRTPDRAQAAPSTPPPKDAAVKTGPHFSENIRLTLMAHRPYRGSENAECGMGEHGGWGGAKSRPRSGRSDG